MSLLMQALKSKQSAQAEAKAEADSRRQSTQDFWQAEIDRAVELLKAIGVEKVESPSFTEGRSSVNVAFSVQEVPCFLLLVPGTISIYVSTKLLGMLDLEQQTPEAIAQILADGLIAYAAELQIDIIAAPEPPKKRNGTPKAEG